MSFGHQNIQHLVLCHWICSCSLIRLQMSTFWSLLSCRWLMKFRSLEVNQQWHCPWLLSLSSVWSKMPSKTTRDTRQMILRTTLNAMFMIQLLVISLKNFGSKLFQGTLLRSKVRSLFPLIFLFCIHLMKKVVVTLKLKILMVRPILRPSMLRKSSRRNSSPKVTSNQWMDQSHVNRQTMQFTNLKEQLRLMVSKTNCLWELIIWS